MQVHGGDLLDNVWGVGVVQAPIESNMRQPMDRSEPPLVHYSCVCRATIRYSAEDLMD